MAPPSEPPNAFAEQVQLSQGNGAGSTTDAAKQEAANVKDTAVSAGADVAQTAKEQAGNVVAEAKSQGTDLLHQARGEVREQAGTQMSRVADALHSLSKELGEMASKSDQNGPMTDLAQQASRKGGEIAHWLQDREPTDVLDEVKSFARRRPVAFLGICFAAGVVAGRLTRGAVAANGSLDSPSSPDRAPQLERSYAQPEYAGPEYAGHEYGQPEYGRPGYGQPGYGHTGSGQPGYGQPGSAGPDYASTAPPVTIVESAGYSEDQSRVPGPAAAAGVDPLARATDLPPGDTGVR